MYVFCFVFFFFQAEDGIRDWSVTGVQTCALPISKPAFRADTKPPFDASITGILRNRLRGTKMTKIGRASCRERVKISVVDVSLKKKRKEKNRAKVLESHSRNMKADSEMRIGDDQC